MDHCVLKYDSDVIDVVLPMTAKQRCDVTAIGVNRLYCWLTGSLYCSSIARNYAECVLIGVETVNCHYNGYNGQLTDLIVLHSTLYNDKSVASSASASTPRDTVSLLLNLLQRSSHYLVVDWLLKRKTILWLNDPNNSSFFHSARVSCCQQPRVTGCGFNEIVIITSVATYSLLCQR